ncbi:MAG: DUF1579 family protein [Pirellulales bacterium]
MLLSWFSLGHPATARADELPPEAPAVLSRFSGQWETQTTIRRQVDSPRVIDTRGSGECRQTLEGRYFEFRTRTVPAGQAELQIMTFDVEDGVFRQWVFSSDGYFHEAQGSWDAATSTLRWTGKTADSSFVILDRFVSPDRLDWTLRRTNSAGRLLQTIEGTLTRLKAN